MVVDRQQRIHGARDGDEGAPNLPRRGEGGELRADVRGRIGTTPAQPRLLDTHSAVHIRHTHTSDVCQDHGALIRWGGVTSRTRKERSLKEEFDLHKRPGYVTTYTKGCRLNAIR